MRGTHANSIDNLLSDLLSHHDRIIAARADVEAAKIKVRGAWADYLPSADLTGDFGHENQNKVSGSDNTSTGFNEVLLSGSQLIWDGRKTLKKVDRTEFAVRQAELNLEKTRQSLIREGVTAFYNLRRAAETLKFARQSEDSIKTQTGLEEALVQQRSGLATDVLQAKATLAGAQATRIQAEGAVAIARNRYRNVFKREAENIEEMEKPRFPLDKMPETIESAIEIALSRNLDLRLANNLIDTAKLTTEIDKLSLYAPSIEFNVDLNYKNNISGTIGSKTEQIFKIKGTYSLFSGGRDYATYQATLKTQEATTSRRANLLRSVEEQVRNAWQRFTISQSNAEFLRNQANIAGEFLELAREERKLGSRSLVDILAQEAAFINSISASLAAETSMALGFYDLMFAMSILDESLFSLGENAKLGKD